MGHFFGAECGTVVGTTVWQTSPPSTVPTRSDPGERARTASWNVEQTKSPGSWLDPQLPTPVIESGDRRAQAAIAGPACQRSALILCSSPILPPPPLFMTGTGVGGRLGQVDDLQTETGVKDCQGHRQGRKGTAHVAKVQL